MRERLLDPHDPYWQTLADEAEVETTHTPIPTYRSTKTTYYTLGGHQVSETHTVYTNRKPNNTQPEEATS